MVREAILKAITHVTLVLFIGLVTLLPLHMVLKLQLNHSYFKETQFQQ